MSRLRYDPTVTEILCHVQYMVFPGAVKVARFTGWVKDRKGKPPRFVELLLGFDEWPEGGISRAKAERLLIQRARGGR